MLRPMIARYFRRPQMFTSELLRQAAATEFMNHFLEHWASEEGRLTLIRFEDLCRNPLEETIRVLEFLDLEYEGEALEKIKRMTSGNSDEYYATDKDSKSILGQPYKYLGNRQLNRLERFLGPA
jgi:hypothetical protein